MDDHHTLNNEWTMKMNQHDTRDKEMNGSKSASFTHFELHDTRDKEMNGSKSASFTHFELVGFPGLMDYKMVLFVGFLILLLITITANLLILFLVSMDHRLHTPMYFFLCNLSLLDMLMAISIIPKLLAVLSGYDNTISIATCFGQMYFIMSIGSAENCLVAAMAYDRYIAVVKPLHYNVIINLKKCVVITAIVWILGFIIPAPSVFLAFGLPYCAAYKIMHCFCDYPAVLSLACADISVHANGTFGAALFVNYVPLLFVLWTYVRIILSVLKLKSTASLAKAFSMCSSHMTVVLMYYVSASVVYAGLKTDGLSPDGRIFIGGLNYFLMPMVNPMIYSLRNEKMKDATKKYIQFKALFPHNTKTSISTVEGDLPKS
ncbi:olfactory receptor 10A6-like [Erpetoichthys calabaricus]|uniref:olfactory receptor 10A6-like n=1 Tax=Erpetoichthys calabaricus TaxID=27687 RepID=UPI0022346A6E|nr:olfactory receptor 10A6-like [Erpetoichthys calabaricus]